MKKISPIVSGLFSILVLLVLYGCSVRYTDAGGHDTLIGFPPGLNEVEEATAPDGGITWRRLRRTGIGLNLSQHSFGFMLGYEHLFLLWVEGNGAWQLFYTPQQGLSVNKLKLPES